MSLSRRVRRRQLVDAKKLLRKAREENRPHVLGSSHIEIVAAMRAMDRSPVHDDTVDELDYRRARNRRKRERRAGR